MLPQASSTDSILATSSSSAIERSTTLERLAEALQEGRALALAVVGEHDELVWSRRELGDALESRELLIEPAQHVERVAAFDPGVVGDLVVADERGVAGRHALEHVADQREDVEVAHHDGHAHAQQRVDAAAIDARLNVELPLAAASIFSVMTSQMPSEIVRDGLYGSAK